MPSSRAAHVNPESNGLSLYVSRLPREISGALQDEQSAALLSHGRPLSQSYEATSGHATAQLVLQHGHLIRLLDLLRPRAHAKAR